MWSIRYRVSRRGPRTISYGGVIWSGCHWAVAPACAPGGYDASAAVAELSVVGLEQDEWLSITSVSGVTRAALSSLAPEAHSRDLLRHSAQDCLRRRRRRHAGAPMLRPGQRKYGYRGAGLCGAHPHISLSRRQGSRAPAAEHARPGYLDHGVEADGGAGHLRRRSTARKAR
jgi:hypothetical protein